MTARLSTLGGYGWNRGGIYDVPQLAVLASEILFIIVGRVTTLGDNIGKIRQSELGVSLRLDIRCHVSLTPGKPLWLMKFEVKGVKVLIGI